MTAAPHPEVLEEGRRVVDAAEAAGVPARLLGGAAISLRTLQWLHPALRRTPLDIDVATAGGAGRALAGALRAAGYRPDEAFNRLEGHRRMLFHDDANGRQLDVFVREFAMCHSIPIGERLTLEPVTLPLAELTLTKLQIVELNAKDRLDLYALLATHPVGDADGSMINAARIARVCARDWGLYRTATLNLERLRAHLGELPVDRATRERIAGGVDVTAEAIEGAPKSRGWRLRARVGERLRWYEQPDEVGEE
jgi:hypothetical protein